MFHSIRVQGQLLEVDTKWSYDFLTLALPVSNVAPTRPIERILVRLLVTLGLGIAHVRTEALEMDWALEAVVTMLVIVFMVNCQFSSVLL